MEEELTGEHLRDGDRLRFGQQKWRHDLERDALLARDAGDLGDDVTQELRRRLVGDRLGRSRRRVLLVRAECAPLPLDDSGGTHERVAEASRCVRIEIVEHRPDLVEQPTGPVEPGVELLQVHEVVVDGLGPLEVTRPQQRGQPRGRVLRVGPRRPGGRTGRVGVEEELDSPRVGGGVLIQLAHEVERSGEWLAVEDPAVRVPEVLRRWEVHDAAGAVAGFVAAPVEQHGAERQRVRRRGERHVGG